MSYDGRMSLQLPGERGFRWLEVFLAMIVVLGLCALGCVAPAPECADRAGIVESVGTGGRITFVEAQGGRVRRRFVDPAHPSSRRDARGEILNSFLRPIRIDDPPGARYFAGEMLCGVARA